jgi:hypothetical protein
MKILSFADLHLGDSRCTPEYDLYKLNCLQKLTDDAKPDILINIGDTVSKESSLRDLKMQMDYWQQYLNFKKKLLTPIVETCISRERSLFQSLFESECDFSFIKDDIGFISFDPLEEDDHTMTLQQMEWIETTIKSMKSKMLLLISHVPIAQTTRTREVMPDIFLTQSDTLKNLTATYATSALFLGGHFHTSPEPPIAESKNTLAMGGCFGFSIEEKEKSYFRMIDIKNKCMTIQTINTDNEDIMPTFNTNV